MEQPERKRTFTFVNYGGSYQLRIDGAEDLRHLDNLDDPFWMATSAPTDQMICDPVALEYLDSSGNGRIISGELRRARQWLFRVLENLDGVSEGRGVLHLEDVDESDPEGAQLLVAARRILANLDRGHAPTISLAEIRNTRAILAKGAVNGDGIVPPHCVDDPDLQQLLRDVATTMGTRPGIDGTGGIDRALLDDFVKQAKALLAWQRKVSDPKSKDHATLLPLGPKTPVGYRLFARLQSAVHRYFKLCELQRLNESLGRTTTEPASPEVAYTSEAALQRYLERAPIAPPNAALELRLSEALNPHYAEDLQALRERVLEPLCPSVAAKGVLPQAEWRKVQAALRPYQQWLDTKQGAQVESLGTSRLEQILDGDLIERAGELMVKDQAVGRELAAIDDLEHLVLMQRWLLEICNNFVSFRNMYEPATRAIFEIGRLVIDGRVFHFNLRVTDIKKHREMAARSGMFLLYSEVSAARSDESFYMVTPVTTRDRGNLGVDKRGVLLDLDGRQWDVRVVAVVENPISLSEAVAAPFKRMSALITSAVDRISASSEKQLEARLNETTKAVERGVIDGMNREPDLDPEPAPEPTPEPEPEAEAEPPPSPTVVGRTRDMVVTGGVALAAVGSSFAFIARTLADLQFTRTVTAIAIAFAVVLVPIIIVAMFKLHARNLSSILEASGWAINARLRLTRGLARMLAPDPVHPDSYERLRRDLIRKAIGPEAQRVRAMR
ncbi:MAG: hypothetical protein AAF799_39355 [Myxococcota bacterium]